MRRPLVAGNWKMNGARADSAALVRAVLHGLPASPSADVAICPPFILIPLVADLLAGTPVSWGGQNVSAHKSGAYTGEIAGSMLKDYGCSWAIVGHSERRTLFAETDQVVADKFIAAQDLGLVPILCVGETLEEREHNQTEAVVARQLDAVLARAGIAAFERAVIAYEPVWAIGTGRNASPEQAQAVHAFIRGRLTQRDRGIGDRTRILYGGSVKGNNAAALFTQPDIDGGLIGGASLNADDFLAICQAAK
jgi:triosephosphate isomerase